MAMSAIQRSAYTALAPLLTSVGLFLARTLSVRRGSSKGALSFAVFLAARTRGSEDAGRRRPGLPQSGAP